MKGEPGLTGPRGSKGSKGQAGLKGTQGVKGDTGIPVEIELFTLNLNNISCRAPWHKTELSPIPAAATWQLSGRATPLLQHGIL